jgi:predicted dehydrogenase
MADENDEYGLSPEKVIRQMKAPKVDYLPPKPKTYNPKIGIIGTGGISDFHLKNYKDFDFDVAAIANRTLSKAEQKRDKYYPDAQVYEDYKNVLERDDIEVVDITPHPLDRLPIVKEALRAKKHVLSQKPFVLDLNDGKELVNIARENKVKLAVNQNGRWAPHFSYMRAAINSGLIGKPLSVDFSLQWDQTWVAGNAAFESIKHMILFDFAIHWFDIAACFMQGQKVKSIYASATRYEGQKYSPPALAACIIKYEQAQVSMSFNAHTLLGEEDVTTIVGTKGTLRSRGPGLNDQPTMEVYTDEGTVHVPLVGSWFENGFKGTMGELLCAIEENREPVHSAENNLTSLELCFAALESATQNRVVVPGDVLRVPQ